MAALVHRLVTACVARVAEFGGGGGGGGARQNHPRCQSTSEVNPDTVHKDRL